MAKRVHRSPESVSKDSAHTSVWDVSLFIDCFHSNLFLLLKHRQVLLEIFSKNYRVRRNMIQSRLTQECGEDLSKQEVDKVLKVRLLLWPERQRGAARPLVVVDGGGL